MDPNVDRRCENCLYFRPTVPIRSVIEQQVFPTHEDAIKALDENAAKDEANRMKELAFISPGEHGEAVWPQRPRTTPYCGLFEDRDFYYVCSVKNARGDCADFQTRSSPRLSVCESCIHRIQANGDSVDREDLFRIAERIAYCSVQPVALQAEYQKLEKSIGALKAYEVREAYRNYGCLPRPPKYLNWCKARSKTNRYHMPECLNMQKDCSEFAPLPELHSAQSRTTSGASRTPNARWKQFGKQLLHRAVQECAKILTK
jgi:hypothetical protein